MLIVMFDQMSGVLLDDDRIDVLHIPNIRHLIARGVKFDNAYSSSPLCTPARGAFMTGQLPSRSGIYDNAAEFAASIPTFAHYLRKLGYQTALSGKMHFVGPDQLHGFEERLTTDIYPADFGWTPDWERPLERVDWWYHNLGSVTGAGVAEITNQLEFDDEVAYQARLKLFQYSRRKDPRPFCLTVSFTHPHDPYVARQQYWDLYEHQRIPMPRVPALAYQQQDPHSQRLLEAVDFRRFEVTDEHVRRARHASFANISYLDDKVGELLRVLEQCDFSASTHVILCADHGDMLGERGLWYKMNFFEASCRIPLIMAAPERATARRVATPVALHDLLPTLVALAGGNTNAIVGDIDGRDVLDLAAGKEDVNRVVYSEYCAEGSVSPIVMIRRGQYKFCFCEQDPPQLFDLQTDPLEMRNLATDPAHAGVVEDLIRAVYARWDFKRFARDVRQSQKNRRLVNHANRLGKFTAWDFQPQLDARERFMRNHMDLNVLEAEARYPKR
jgi:choline-sulfatase